MYFFLISVLYLERFYQECEKDDKIIIFHFEAIFLLGKLFEKLFLSSTFDPVQPYTIKR